MKRVLSTALTILVTASVTFAGTSVLYAVNSAPAQLKKSGVDKKLDTVNTYINNNYLYDDYDSQELSDAAVRAYVEALDEPYTHYYSAEEFEDYLGGVEESYVGIGVVISVDEEADKIIIVAPTEDSPAHEAGLLPGDYITAVDGTAYSGDEMEECVRAIKGGAAGTKVKISIERGGESKEIEVERREISSNSVKSEMLDGNIGYVRITGFNTNDDGSEENTFTEFREQVDALRAQGMQKMVIDLRDNPGGVLDVVCDIADYLLPEGIITYTETKNGEREEFKSDAAELDIPMAVLINGNSASASEILTGALKDYGRAKVVGETSFGKGIVQSVYPFYDGSGMSMTIARYFTPNGVCIHDVGIEPDYEVALPDEYKDGYVSDVPRDKDTQLNKALEVLK